MTADLRAEHGGMGGDPPNVVMIVFDDMGFAELGCFGSDIATPNIDRLAGDGLRYNRFHVTALCSPTRASLLTGRNHHAVGMGSIVDVQLPLPGYTGRIPKEAATLPRVLRDAGYNTFAVGKWHLVPPGERSPSGPFERWPLGLGFERYYGFLPGATSQWAPKLVADNHPVDPPGRPEDGYHLTEDLTDQAIRMVMDQRGASGKPFFLYYALGAMHAPHHVAPEWVAPYRGRYDSGWDRWRDEAFARQVDLGVVPDGTVLTERPPWVARWDDLSPDDRTRYAIGREVYGGFLTHSDAQIGRLLDALATIGALENTLVMVMSDNGASAEGGPHGSVNTHRRIARIADPVDDPLASRAQWGGFRTFPNYAWGWAWAGNTPFRLWKRYSWLGGTRTSLVVHWPRGIEARGELRDQFCHAIDVMPTILDVCGVTPPETVDGLPAQRIDGDSFAPSFDTAAAPPPRQTQYFEILGSRSIVDGGWKATTDHVSRGNRDEERSLTGSRDFASDHWSLFDLESDFSEAVDLSAAHPEVVRRLEQRWLDEAERNDVLPMSDVIQLGSGGEDQPVTNVAFAASPSPIHEEVLPRLTGGFRMSVDVDVVLPTPEGVLFAVGDWTGGYALYVVDGELRFTFAPAGAATTVVAPCPVAPGRHTIAVTYLPADGGGSRIRLHCDRDLIASADVDTRLPPVVQFGGAPLYLGHDRGFPVSDDYAPPFRWNGTIHEIRIDIPGDGDPARLDLWTALQAD